MSVRSREILADQKVTQLRSAFRRLHEDNALIEIDLIEQLYQCPDLLPLFESNVVLLEAVQRQFAFADGDLVWLE